MMKSGRRILTWLRRLALVFILLCLLLAISGFIYERLAESKDQKRWKPTGQMIDVSGTSLHVLFLGTNNAGPTVVFESGLCATTDGWETILRETAKFAPALAYERAGTGWSAASTEAPDADHTAQRLHRLLERLNVRPPIVLVGSSLGGLYARGYAARFPSEVAGAVLVDSSHPQMNERLPENIRAELRNYSRSIHLGAAAAPLGLPRIALRLGLFPLPVDAAQRDRIISVQAQPKHLRAARRELNAWKATVAQATSTNGFIGKPLTVLAAEKSFGPEWLELQKSLASLSQQNSYQVVTGADHITILTEPRFSSNTVAAIRGVVDSVRRAAGAER